jgi:hypothetical protein
VGFALRDSKGKQRIKVGARDEEGPAIRLQDDSQATNMLLALGKRGNPRLLMGDGKEAGDAVWLGYESEKGIPRLRLKHGAAEFEARVNRDGPLTILNDNKGIARLILSALEHGAFLHLNDNKERVRASLGAVTDGGPGFALFDDKDRVLFSKP